MVAGGLAAGEMALPLTNIRTPRAEAAKILESNQGETGSGPKFAGDEDKYFLEGIEEVLAQWEPEVGAMPPVDKKALGLPEQCKLRPIKAKSGQLNMAAVMAGEADTGSGKSTKSTGTPSFRPAKDTVFLDGLEEVVPLSDEEDAGPPERAPSAPSVDVLTPLEVPAVALTVGDIKTQAQLPPEEYERAEGPEFEGTEDAVFLEGLEEVVGDWEDRPGEEGSAPVEDEDVDDSFFLTGLEEVVHEADGTSWMHHTIDPRALDIQERPASISIRTAAPDSPKRLREPRWAQEDDTTFLDAEEMLEGAVSSSLEAERAPRVNPAALRLHKNLRVRTPPRGEMAQLAQSPGASTTPANTPNCSAADAPQLRDLGDLGVTLPAAPDTAAPPTATPNNTPLDTDCTTTPTAAPGRTASGLFRDIEGAGSRLAASRAGDEANYHA